MPQLYTNKNDTFADHFIDENKCAETLRQIRWPNGQITCPYCGSTNITNAEINNVAIRRYRCNDCKKSNKPKVTFNDRTGTIFAGSKLPLKKWFYAITLIRNKSSADNLAAELQVDGNTANRMMLLIQGSIFLNRNVPIFTGKTESDEVYITAGCKGSPVNKPKNRDPRKRGLKKRGGQLTTMTDRRCWD